MENECKFCGEEIVLGEDFCSIACANYYDSQQQEEAFYEEHSPKTSDFI